MKRGLRTTARVFVPRNKRPKQVPVRNAERRNRTSPTNTSLLVNCSVSARNETPGQPLDLNPLELYSPAEGDHGNGPQTGWDILSPDDYGQTYVGGGEEYYDAQYQARVLNPCTAVPPNSACNSSRSHPPNNSVPYQYVSAAGLRCFEPPDPLPPLHEICAKEFINQEPILNTLQRRSENRAWTTSGCPVPDSRERFVAQIFRPATRCSRPKLNSTND